MQEFVMLVGPSGCGKSTWAKEFNENHDHQYIIHFQYLLITDIIR